MSANFNRCLYQQTRVSGVKISAVHCLVLSQSTRVTDRRVGVNHAPAMHMGAKIAMHHIRQTCIGIQIDHGVLD